jgi:hypothetical protein
LDTYFDLSGPQEEYLKPQVKALHAWHRQDQLPQYTKFLHQLDQFGKDGLSEAEIEMLFSTVQTFRRQLAKQASPAGARFVATVTPVQIRHLQEVFNEDHHRLLARLRQEESMRIERRTTKILEVLTTWVGELSAVQEIHLRPWLAEILDGADLWLEHRRRRQAMLLTLLNSSQDARILEPALYTWLADGKAGGTPEFLKATKQWRTGIGELTLKVDQILTPDQRMHFSYKLQRLIKDIQALES